MPQNTDYKNTNSDSSTVTPVINQEMPEAIAAIAYRKRLNGWAVARIVTEQEKVIIARFRSRSDAEGYIQHIRQLIPDTAFDLFFDCQREEVVM